MSKERRYTKINGRSYFLVIKETPRLKRVSVYDGDMTSRRRVKNDTDIVFDREWRGRFRGLFGEDNSPPIERIVERALNKAVCIREQKEEEEQRYEERLSESINNVKELHEEE